METKSIDNTTDVLRIPSIANLSADINHAIKNELSHFINSLENRELQSGMIQLIGQAWEYQQNAPVSINVAKATNINNKHDPIIITCKSNSPKNTTTSNRSLSKLNNDKTLKTTSVALPTSRLKPKFGIIHAQRFTRSTSEHLMQGKSQCTSKRQQKRVTTVILRPSKYLINLGFRYETSVNLSWSLTGWNLQATRIIPSDSDIFKFCKQGNLEGVRFLLDRGLASTRDVDENGSSPLHVCNYPILSLSVDLMRPISMLPKHSK